VVIESRKESMMLSRRGPLGVLLLVSFGLLLGAALFGGTAAVGGLLAAPFIALGFVFKIVLFFILFGLVARLLAGTCGRGRRSRGWSGSSREWWSDEARSRWSGRSESSQSHEGERDNDRFEEWHRMAHAHQEVDDHTPPVED
jgi:hypothetical protein